MKKLLTVIFAICPMIASADYLDDKIANLTKQKLDKIEKLQECQKNTKGLKIAGITTLGVSAIGIGANIGEAVALNKLDDKIDTAVKTKSSLDTQINDERRLQELQKQYPSCGEENLCGSDDVKNAFIAANPGADGAICVNGNWKIAICKTTQPEENKHHCLRGNNVMVYFDSCNGTIPGHDINNTCGTNTCDFDAPTQSGLDLLNAKDAVCINGVWKAKTCKANFAGTEQTCTKNGQTITYIDKCSPVGNSTCGEQNCSGNAELAAGSIDGATVAVCVNNQWKVKACENGIQPRNQQTCVLNGETITYYDSCCVPPTSDWLAQRNATAGACDMETGEMYITECKSTHPIYIPRDGGKPGYKECTTGSVPERKYHDACTAEETAKIPNAATSWRYNGKCVAKSCKPNTYLHVKNGVSQGQCMTACPAWQITNWANGGQACDVAKTKPEEQTPVQERCTRVLSQVAVNDSSCKSQCAKFATDNKCLWNQEYLWKNNICICTPNQSDRNTVLNIGNVTPSAPVQENDTTTVVKPDYVEPIVTPAKPGRDMGGAALYYKQAVKGQDINPYVEIDGKKYQGYATAGYPRAQRALENLRKKLEDAGYSNFNLVAGY